MIVFLLKFIFLALSVLLNLVSKLIFTIGAYVLVLSIQAFKVPGEAIRIALDQVGNVIRACLEYLLEIVTEAISTLISSFFDLLKDGISESVTATGSAIGGLMDNARTSFDALLNDIPELFEGFTEMISTVVNNLWNNYKDAAGYVTENIRSK